MKQMVSTSRMKNIKQMNANLPVLLISGKDDPLGDYGKGIRKLGRLYKKQVLNISQYNCIKIKDMKYFLKKAMLKHGIICMNG